MGGASRSVHDKDAVAAEAGAVEQRLDPAPHGRVGKWRKPVEQRCDEYRVGPGHGEGEPDPQRPDVQPPQAAHGVHEPQRRHDERCTDHRQEQHLSGQIGDEHSGSRTVEPEAFLDDKSLVDRKRQVQRPHRQKQAQYDQGSGYDRPLAEAMPQTVEKIEPASERPQHEQHRAGSIVDQAEAGGGDGIIGCLAVIGERNAIAECGRDLVAMRTHVAHVPPAQPDLGQEHGGQCAQEKYGKRVHRPGGAIIDRPSSVAPAQPGENVCRRTPMLWSG